MHAQELKTNANGAGIATGPTLTGPWLPRHASMSRRLGARRFRHSIRRSHRLCRSALAPASGMISPYSSIPLGRAVRDRVASAASYRDRFPAAASSASSIRRSSDLSATTDTRPFHRSTAVWRSGCLRSIAGMRTEGVPVPSHRHSTDGPIVSVNPSFSVPFGMIAFRHDPESYLPFRPSKNAPHR